MPIILLRRSQTEVYKLLSNRYDDREVIQTNLIESYDQLMNFAKKHLPDKFFLEDVNRVSLRNIIAREMISNTLMHREFTSSYMAKFVIEKDQMYVENANRAIGAQIKARMMSQYFRETNSNKG